LFLRFFALAADPDSNTVRFRDISGKDIPDFTDFKFWFRINQCNPVHDRQQRNCGSMLKNNWPLRILLYERQYSMTNRQTKFAPASAAGF
jgi:hypothetical protein